MELDPGKTAVLALHFMRDTIEPDRAFGAAFNPMVVANGVLEHTATVLDAAREAGATVVYARVVFPREYAGMEPSTPLYAAVMQSGGFQEGSEGIDIVEQVAPHSSDIVLDHLGTSAFIGGELDEIFAQRGIDTVVATGVTTNVIVEGTARDAGNRNLKTFVLSDCCSAGDQATHDASLANLGLIIDGVATSDDFLSAIAKDAG